MTAKLTTKQQEILSFIAAFIKSKGYPPTPQEIGDHFNIVRNAAACHLDALEAKGFVRLTPKISRSLVLLWAEEAADFKVDES